MDRGVWWATNSPWGHKDLDTTDQLHFHYRRAGFTGGSDSKESAHGVGDLNSIPGLGRFPGEGYGNSLQYSCLENSMDRGVWGHKELNTTE